MCLLTPATLIAIQMVFNVSGDGYFIVLLFILNFKKVTSPSRFLYIWYIKAIIYDTTFFFPLKSASFYTINNLVFGVMLRWPKFSLLREDYDCG